MPIRRELRHFYRGPAYAAFRERIRARAGDRCEQCGKPNGEQVETVTFRNFIGDPFMLWRSSGSPWWGWHNGRFSRARRTDEFFGGPGWRRSIRSIRVVCHAAHLNHVPGDDREENVKFLCQWCHLNYDKLHHHETRARRKDAGRPLLAMANA